MFTWTVTHRETDPAFEVPYVVLVVEMDEGVRVIGSVSDLDPRDLRLDLPVTVELERMNDAVALLNFRPTEGEPPHVRVE